MCDVTHARFVKSARGDVRASPSSCIVLTCPVRTETRPPAIFHVYTHGVWAADELFATTSIVMVFLRELVRAAERSNGTVSRSA